MSSRYLVSLTPLHMLSQLASWSRRETNVSGEEHLAGYDSDQGEGAEPDLKSAIYGGLPCSDS